MAKVHNLSTALAQIIAAALNVNVTGFGGAVMTIYSNSTTIPTDSDTALDGAAVALATVTLPVALNNVAALGVITFGDITVVQGLATGVASYYRTVSSGGTVLDQGSVGLAAGDFDLEMDNTTITLNEDVDINGYVYTVTKQAA